MNDEKKKNVSYKFMTKENGLKFNTDLGRGQVQQARDIVLGWLWEVLLLGFRSLYEFPSRCTLGKKYFCYPEQK